MPVTASSRVAADAASSSLRPQNLNPPLNSTRFPLASPILQEETGHTFTSTGKGQLVDANDTSSHAAEHVLTDSDNGDTSGYDEFHLEKYTTNKQRGFERPSRTESKRLQEAKAKKTRPGLNVVTDFSKTSRGTFTHDHNTRHADHTRSKSGSKEAIGIGSVGIKQDLLADLAVNPSKVVQGSIRNTASNGQPYESLDSRQFGSNNPLVYHNPTLESLKRSDTMTTGPSPSARTVMIGIGEQDLDSAARESEGTTKPGTPLTPSILITPAYEDTIFPDSSISNDHNAKKRPASSIYSQATPYLRFESALGKQPPIPKIPYDHSNKPADLSQTQDNNQSAESAAQTYQENRQKLRSRAASDETRKGILRRSLDSFALRPQSKGWWNLGLSPMLSRAGTISSRKDLFEDEKAPPVPPISPSKIKSAKGLGLEEKDWESEFSPQTPRRIGFDSSRASTWSSWSDWERSRDGPDQSTAQAHEAMKAAQQYKSPELLSTSPVIGGLAAEYFHASAHDLISPAPYFECQYHSCAEKLPELESIHDPVEPASRGLAGVTPSDKAHDSSHNPSIGGLRSMDGSKEMPSSNATGVVDTRHRSDSESTVIDDTPSCSPTNSETKDRNMSEAAASPAPAPAPHKGTKGIEPTSSPQKSSAKGPPYPIGKTAVEPPFSPGPVPPLADRDMASNGAIQMSEVQHGQPPHIQPIYNYSINMPAPTPRAPFVRENSDNDIRGGRQGLLTATNPPARAAPMASPAFLMHSEQGQNTAPPARGFSIDEDHGRLDHSPTPSDRPIIHRARAQDAPNANEKASARESKPSLFAKVREFLSRRKQGDRKKKNKCLLYVIITTALLSIVITVLLLAILLSRHGDNTPVEVQWLNLTGYPPIPTGISTIAQPDLTHESSNCVFPRTMWSCSLPKEQQESVAPNNANQPNFRIEIRFKNGTVSNGTAPTQASKRSSPHLAILAERDPFTNDLFTPDPAAPSLAEQSFLGNTTDNTTAPFEGEATPFFITFLDPAKLDNTSTADSNPSKVKRQFFPSTTSSSSPSSSLSSSAPTSSSTSNITSTSGLPSLPTSLPPPSSQTFPNGTVSPASLLPLPVSQPIRLFDRGLPTEHYGFYTYFSKSIFLRSSAPLNSTTAPEGDIPEDENGGSTAGGASVRCTWAQTRFLVRIWTNQPHAALLGDDNNNSTKPAKTKTPSANDFTRPGSMPYPVTVTLDRHGGDPETKLLFCYAVDERGKISGEGKVQEEFRDIDGKLVNPIPGLFDISGNNGNDDDGTDGFDIHAGGVDGGTGGCGCEWSNFHAG